MMIGRACNSCDEFDLTDTQRLCPYCGGSTVSLDDYHEARWYAVEQDKMSEPMPSMAQLHRAAWDDRQALRMGRAF